LTRTVGKGGVVVISALAVPYRDTHASRLGWSLDAAEQPAVAVLDVRLATAWSLQLRVLGASHQVVLRAPDASARVNETVACLAAPLPPLPEWAALPLAGLDYTLRTEVAELSDRQFADTVDALMLRHGADPDALIGAFPGDRTAVTVLWADRGAPALSPGTTARWRTWHAYPQHRQIVSTTTVVRTGERGIGPCVG
jgi:hypothetical protein